MKINNADLIISKIWRILKKRNKKKNGKQHKKLHLCLLILKGLSGSAKAARDTLKRTPSYIFCRILDVLLKPKLSFTMTMRRWSPQFYRQLNVS